ncbi:phosphopentomutase [Cognaticolwellia beringensis]|uniref:Phosphopentomutase n=1 Tax=Cognaticolwellia beringensis TaxID=1967665 RepID=A0A222GCH2_9GAMM|nr:phosphopentomutase [Cognaticolwellia beringensis]ASP49540.1 phosphopentomutase [Cognaticolwellia beringensis]
MARAIVLVIDSFGIGHAPDAADFGDISANTFANLARYFYQHEKREIKLTNLAKMGLVQAAFEAGKCTFPVVKQAPEQGAFGYAAEISTGKDTPSGHWEMMGVPVLFDWDYFPKEGNAFPTDLIEKINQATGYDGILGDCHASGTDIINKLGQAHIKSGLPICYTSADSVFQVAAHEEHFGLDNLYKYCETVRELLGDMNVGRVIARPFIGNSPEDFTRTGNRRDYSVLPPAPTVLDVFTQAGGHVISVGKIADIYAHQGISEKTKATGIDALVDATISHINTAQDNSLIFTNLVNFDQDYGHRRDPVGYALALESFDLRLPEIISAMNEDDVLFLTADHGCDPTWHGNDHTREYVPVIAFHKQVRSVNIGERNTFADIGQTIAELFKLDKMPYGTSFLSDLDL